MTDQASAAPDHVRAQAQAIALALLPCVLAGIIETTATDQRCECYACQKRPAVTDALERLMRQVAARCLNLSGCLA